MGTLAKRAGFDLSMITIKLADPRLLDNDGHIRLARQLSDAVKSVLRQVDLAFEQQENSEAYSVLLPTTNREGAQIVLEKIRTSLRSRIGEMVDQCTFSIQVIYDKSQR